MKSLFTKYTWLQLILSILLLFGGALIIVFAVMQKDDILLEGLNIIVAVILFLFGLFAIIASFAFELDKVYANGLLYGSACIALGVFLCMGELKLLNYLVLLLAIFFIVVGSVELIRAVLLIIRKARRVPAIIISFVIATIFIAGGILAIIYRDQVKLVFCIVAGILLFAAGVFLLVTGIKDIISQSKGKGGKKTTRKSSKKEKEEIKEIDYTSEE